MKVEVNDNYIKNIINSIRKIDYIKPGEVPNIDLYMDQVTTFMDNHLESSKRYEDDKLLTKTMINNYTKNNLIPSPDKKKYTKDHMYLLIFIYHMKNFLSISDIQNVLEPLSKKFFKNENGISLEQIYQEIFNIETEQSMVITKDLIQKIRKSRNVFTDIENEEDREFLKIFSFICMLSFDVYMKKQVIEQLIDENTLLSRESGKDAKKAAASAKEQSTKKEPAQDTTK